MIGGFNMKRKRKNLKLNITSLYIIITLFFVAGFIFFSSSKMFLAEDIPENQTELNKEFDLRSNGAFEISNWLYDSETEKMEVILVTNGMKDYKSQLNFSSVSREDLGTELPIEVVYQDNEIYIIHIKNVKKGFTQIALRLHKSEKEIEDLFNDKKTEVSKKDGLISTIYTDERLVDRSSILDKDKEEYIKEITQKMITESLSLKEKEEENIVTYESLLDNLAIEIEELEDELLYQTLDEQVDTNNQIHRLENEVSNYEKEIEESRINIENLQLKVNRLEQKKRELQL